MTHPVVERFGRDWLAHGAMDVRLRKPVYDGREVRVVTDDGEDGAVAVTLYDENDERCAEGTARVRAARSAVDAGACRVAPLPDPRPPASAAVLAAADPLGTVTKRFDAVTARSYLDGICEPLTIYGEGIAHPGWLLRRANRILAANVVLGPWIHVESHVTNLDLVHDNDLVSTRGGVTRVWERGGHKLVALDVLITVDERPVTYIDHVAIYEPRHA